MTTTPDEQDGQQDERGLTLRTSRYLPATPEQVFEAYTDADQQKAWFSILDDEPGVVEIEVDLRVGGTQTAVWGPSPDRLFREVQTFVVVERPRRLVTESVGSTPDGETMTTSIEVLFEVEGQGTRMSLRQSGFPTPQVRDFFAAQAWVGAFARIEAHLLRTASS